MESRPSPSLATGLKIEGSRRDADAKPTATVKGSQGLEDFDLIEGTVTRGEEVAGPVSEQDVVEAAKQKRIHQLTARNEALAAEIRQTSLRVQAVTKELRSPHAAPATVKRHIALLHRYNETRDIGQALLGLVADTRGVRIRDVYGDGEEFGVREGD